MHDTPTAPPAHVSPGRVAVGLDLGTSGLKGVAIAPDGRVVAHATGAYPTLRRAPGAAEQDTAAWLAALGAVVAGLAREVAPSRWQAVGLSAMIPTLVAAGADLAPLGDAVTWEDPRAEGQARRLRDAVGPDALAARTGQWVDGRYLLPMAMRLREAGDPRGTAPVLAGAKDWLFARLTGELATDPSTAAGFGCLDLDAGRWDPDLLGAALGGGDPLPALPEIRRPDHTAPLRPEAATDLGLPSGLPIALGAADSVLAARGLGADRPGDIAYITGTSTVILALADRAARDPGHRWLVTPADRPGAFGLEMDLVATGSAVRWLARLLGTPDGEAGVWRLAGSLGPGADGILFLPYLGPGEQGALWDPTLRGTLAGLTLAHGPAHVARALLDGITLESRRCLAALGGATGERGGLVMGGPAASSGIPARALADATGLAVRRPADPEHPASAWGAASLALEATGGEAPPGPRLAAAVAPRPPEAALWDGLWARHEAARQAMAQLAAQDADRTDTQEANRP